MKAFPDYADDRYKGYCIHCGASVGSKPFNNDHVPSKTLLDRPFPGDLPTVEVCEDCNTSFSPAEAYLAAILACVISGSCEPREVRNHRVAMALSADRALSRQMQAARTEHLIADGQTQLVWNPDPALVRRALIKNARGHYFYECGEPLHGEPARVWYRPLHTMGVEARIDFEAVAELAAWPEVGSRLLQRVATGADMSDGWIIVQDDIYRYRIVEDDQSIRMIIREYLACEVSWSEAD